MLMACPMPGTHRRYTVNVSLYPCGCLGVCHRKRWPCLWMLTHLLHQFQALHLGLERGLGPAWWEDGWSAERSYSGWKMEGASRMMGDPCISITQTCVGIMAMVLSKWRTSGNSFNLSELSFLICNMGKSLYFTQLLWKLIYIIHIKMQSTQ